MKRGSILLNGVAVLGLAGCVAVDPPGADVELAGPATEAVEEAEALDLGDDPEARLARLAYVRGLELRASHQPAAALVAFNQVLSHDPAHYRAHYHLGLCYYELGDAAREQLEYRKCLALNPNYVRALRALGESLFTADDLEQAREVYLRAHELDPHDQRVLYVLGRVEVDLGRPEEGQRLWEQCAARGGALAAASSERLEELRRYGSVK